jgi:hypothetical protein
MLTSNLLTYWSPYSALFSPRGLLRDEPYIIQYKYYQEITSTLLQQHNMSLDFDPLCFLELSQYNTESWDELALNHVNPDPPHLDFDILWSQLNEDSLYSVDSAEPHLSPSPASLAPPQANLPWTPPDIFEIGYQDTTGDWRCNYSGCLSNRVFLRACDLRKHYRSHQKTYFCKEQECHRSKIGFSSSKDCRRHMRSHQPMIKCSAESLGCTRMFSRVGMHTFPILVSYSSANLCR